MTTATVYAETNRRRRRITGRDIPKILQDLANGSKAFLFVYEGDTYVELAACKYNTLDDDLFYVEYVGESNWLLGNRAATGKILRLPFMNGEVRVVRDYVVASQIVMREAVSNFLLTGTMKDGCYWVRAGDPLLEIPL